MDAELIVNLFKGPVIWLSILIYLALIWFGLMVFTWFDISDRSVKILVRLSYTLLVAVGGVFGLFLYLIIRPRLTLSESAQKKLEEKLLVKESLENICPSCGFVLERDYIFCPNCSQNLKKVCLNCSRVSQINWPFCPFCSSKESRLVGLEELRHLGIIKRGRGRPKNLLSESKVASISAEKRQRGRPRKITINLNDVEKRGSGRPRKYHPIPDFSESGQTQSVFQEEESEIFLN